MPVDKPLENYLLRSLLPHYPRLSLLSRCLQPGQLPHFSRCLQSGQLPHSSLCHPVVVLLCQVGLFRGCRLTPMLRVGLFRVSLSILVLRVVLFRDSRSTLGRLHPWRW